MKKSLTTALILTILLCLPLVTAQAPTPPVVPTLGPVILCSNGDFIRIFSPQNHSYSNNQITLSFSVEVVSMLGQFGNVGYNLDGGIVNSVNNFVNKTVDHPSDAPDWYYDRTIAFANVVLPALSEGAHNVTVYYGWQYLGIPENPSLQRFEVFSYKTVDFQVGNSQSIDTNSQVLASSSPSPTPSVPEFSQALTITILVTAAIAVILV